MIQGYLDDSGDNHDVRHSALSVAGYLATTEAWDGFNADWLAVLNKFDISHLHMRELVKQIGPFQTWAKGDVREAALLGELASAIGRAKLKGVGATVVLADVRRFNEETGTDIEATALALYGCALGARQHWATERMELLLDRTTDGKGKVLLAESYGKEDMYYPFMRDFPRIDVLPMDHPIGARGIPGLQAADFLAWEARKNYELKRSWFESERPSPDSPDWGSSLMQWYFRDRIEHMLKHNIKELPIPANLMRRSLSALNDASPIEGIIWDFRTLRQAHEARNGIWGRQTV